jgi:RNA 2',3'-cyclic 3'-phosphodiesterase
VKEELGRAIEALEKSVPGARWVPVQNIHVTLAFLGRVEEGRVAGLSAAIADTVQDHVDFTVRLGELGAFPSVRRARVIWAGLDDPTRGLAGLADSLAEELELLGFPREARTFQPHATIARLKQPAPVAPAFIPSPLSFPVERISLFESHLQRPAALYEELATFSFRR